MNEWNTPGADRWLKLLCQFPVTDNTKYPPEVQPWGSHASGLVVLPDGTVLVDWYAGTQMEGVNKYNAYRGDPLGNTNIYIAYLEKGARRFSEPEVLSGGGLTRHMDANLVLDESGLPWAFYVRDGEVNDTVAYRQGTGGPPWRWSEEYTLGPAMRGRMMNPPLFHNGGLVAPVSCFDKPGPWRDAAVMGSPDKGKTWHLLARIVPDDPLVCLREPCLVAANNGQLHMYTRVGVYKSCWEIAPPDDPRFCSYRAVSNDGGFTWSQPEPVGVPNFNSKVNVVKLPDGRLLMAFNPTPQRFPLVMAISDDLGHTWHPAGVLDPGDGEMSYPSMYIDGENRLHVSYTWKHRELMYKLFAIEGTT